MTASAAEAPWPRWPRWVLLAALLGSVATGLVLHPPSRWKFSSPAEDDEDHSAGVE